MENETIGFEQIEKYIEFLDNKFKKEFENYKFYYNEDSKNINYFNFVNDFIFDDNFLVDFQENDLIQHYIIWDFILYEEEEENSSKNEEFFYIKNFIKEKNLVSFEEILYMIKRDLMEKYLDERTMRF